MKKIFGGIFGNIAIDTPGSRLFAFFSCMYCVLLVMSNVLAGAKLVLLFGVLTISGGTTIFPISYIINNVLAEVYGLKRTKSILIIGIIGLGLASIFTILVQALPADHSWNHHAAYDRILGQFMRVNVASLVAIFVGSYTNAWIVEKLKFLGDGNGHRAFRFVASTAVAEALDTILFLTIAFTGIIPAKTLTMAILGQWLFKTLWEVCALPVTLPVVSALKKFESVS